MIRFKSATVVLCVWSVSCNDNDGLPDDTNAALGTQSGAADSIEMTGHKGFDQHTDGCADYGGWTALLGQATVTCTGTIGPDSYFIAADGRLKNKFVNCVAESTSVSLEAHASSEPRSRSLDNIKMILGLQDSPALPRFRECLTDRHSRWRELFTRTGLKSCPQWNQVAVIGNASKAKHKQLAKTMPHLDYVSANENRTPRQMYDERFVDLQVPTKSNILYNVSYAQPEGACDDPAACAAQCAAFLPNFVVSAGDGQVLVDPASWYRDSNYSDKPCGHPYTEDPYCPQDEFVHQMSLFSTSDGITVPPGDLYGHRNRANVGEHCDRWRPGSGSTPGFNYETDLVLECTDSAMTHCLSRCGN